MVEDATFVQLTEDRMSAASAFGQLDDPHESIESDGTPWIPVDADHGVGSSLRGLSTSDKKSSNQLCICRAVTLHRQRSLGSGEQRSFLNAGSAVLVDK